VIEKKRLKIQIQGAVQGVGFRPFVYRLAEELKLSGFVLNSPYGVLIEIEGMMDKLKLFLKRLEEEKPPASIIQSLEYSYLDPKGFKGFKIVKSEDSGEKITLILPDIATCSFCLEEIFDPDNRRFRYPFTNCTNCGPRFTIIESLPYDRPNTTMKIFKMCRRCREEYENPKDRRFHAQPNACPTCGPHLELYDSSSNLIEKEDSALKKTAQLIREGYIVAVKGLGGFHLMVDARNEEAIERLRLKKPRRDKPFAMMFPDIKEVKRNCFVSEMEERLLLSPECPIVLLKRRPDSPLPLNIAPNNPYLGVMLPYTPLHHLLMKELSFPVIATSGNLTDEPIVIDEEEALRRLGKVADYFLFHTRPIKRHADDSIVRIVMGRELILRRARGYAPLPVLVKERLPKVLALGPHLKNTVALSIGNRVFISQHIGDLETRESLLTFKNTIKDFLELYEFEPEIIACDLHPDYLSTRYAEKISSEKKIPLYKIQHHHAHIASCMAENELEGKVLGISWDGTGYGLDGTVWGGEFLLTSYGEFERVAHFRTFPLLGGDKAIKEPRRVALGLLLELFGEEAISLKLPTIEAFERDEMEILLKAYKKGIGASLTSSAGRLFDAVASILGVRQKITYEGQAAMELEFSSEEGVNSHYPFDIVEREKIEIDWGPIINAIIEDNEPVPLKAAKFHNTLSEIILTVAEKIGEKRILLSGGVFQNKLLTEKTVEKLEEKGFMVYTHQRVPPNDGGISLGQVLVASYKHEG
jgi:hydrogenase maturation protein HypF